MVIKRVNEKKIARKRRVLQIIALLLSLVALAVTFSVVTVSIVTFKRARSELFSALAKFC